MTRKFEARFEQSLSRSTFYPAFLKFTTRDIFRLFAEIRSVPSKSMGSIVPENWKEGNDVLATFLETNEEGACIWGGSIDAPSQRERPSSTGSTRDTPRVDARANASRDGCTHVQSEKFARTFQPVWTINDACEKYSQRCSRVNNASTRAKDRAAFFSIGSQLEKIIGKDDDVIRYTVFTNDHFSFCSYWRVATYLFISFSLNIP